MSRAIPESDWKLFRELRVTALERFCERVLAEVGRVAAQQGKGSHLRYLEVFDLIRRRDKELADAFNDPRRSTALLQLTSILSHGLLTEEEVARLSPETRELVQSLVGTRCGEPEQRR